MSEQFYSHKLAIFFDQTKFSEHRWQYFTVPENIIYDETNETFVPRTQLHADALQYGRTILVATEKDGRDIAEQWEKTYLEKFPGQYFEIWLQPQHLKTHISWVYTDSSFKEDPKILEKLQTKAINMTTRWQNLHVIFPNEKTILFDVSSGGKYAEKIQNLAYRWGLRHMSKILQNGVLRTTVEKHNNKSKASEPIFITNQRISLEKQLRNIANISHDVQTSKMKV